MKKYLIVTLLLAVIGGSVYVFMDKELAYKDVVGDPKNMTYFFSGKPVSLVNGYAEEQITKDASSKIITRYFGNRIKKDINGDGREDQVFLVTQEGGGTGMFFYVAAVLNTEKGHVGSNAMLIGDRIAPQTTESGPGKQIIVNYADRMPGEPFTTRPSQGKSLYLLFDDKTMQFGEVVQNFEGEADPARMTLGMTKWNWIKTTYNNDTEVVPKKAGAFTLDFKDGKVSVSTDCNGMGGSYEVLDNKLKFGDMATTLMYCEGSQEGDFSKMLGEVDSFFFTNKGELVLELKLDSGSMIFK